MPHWTGTRPYATLYCSGDPVLYRELATDDRATLVGHLVVARRTIPSARDELSPSSGYRLPRDDAARHAARPHATLCCSGVACAQVYTIDVPEANHRCAVSMRQEDNAGKEREAGRGEIHSADIGAKKGPRRAPSVHQQLRASAAPNKPGGYEKIDELHLTACDYPHQDRRRKARARQVVWRALATQSAHEMRFTVVNEQAPYVLCSIALYRSSRTDGMGVGTGTSS